MMSEKPRRKRLKEREDDESGVRPAQLAQRAMKLLDVEADRSEGLRLIALAAIRRRATYIALEATEELVGRKDANEGDAVLRAQALIGAGHAREALGSLEGLTSSAASLEAAKAHILLGHMGEAYACATAAIDPAVEWDNKEWAAANWMSAYAAAFLGKQGEPALTGRWRGDAVVDQATPIIALLDYKSPDFRHNSLNLGDWMQSLSAMRHLARLDGVDWSFDDPDLAPLMERLRESWSTNELIACNHRLHLAVVDRDFPMSSAVRFPERDVWVIANGWYASPVFGTTHAWPANANCHPLLLSVHIAKPTDLTPDRLQWLKTNAPVGCRDMSTMRWLQNQGVEAFFSGCMTMTLSLPESGKSDERLSIDPLDETAARGIVLSAEDHDLRRSSFGQAMNQAANRLERIARAASVQTSRLHVALPARAVGTPTEFEPSVPSDRRFDGLIDTDAESFRVIGEQLSAVMAKILPKIADGGDTASISRNIAAVIRESFDIPKPLARQVRSPAVVRVGQPPPEVTVALSFDANFTHQARVVLASIRQHTNVPLRIVLMVRGVSIEEAAAIAAVAKPFDTRIFPMDGRLEGVSIQLGEEIPISTMDRLFLPDLLPGIDKVIYLDCDVLVRGDIVGLASVETGEAGVAARLIRNAHPANIADAMERRARTMSAAEAREFRKWGAENTDLAAPHFNAGVLVLSLDKIRAIGLFKTALTCVERFALHDQDALNLAVGGRTAPIPAEWNANPKQDVNPSPMLVHWAGRTKPWTSAHVRFKAEWQGAFKLGTQPDK
jgi:lipopolysaccharide biosynthesis glycosyltransferase